MWSNVSGTGACSSTSGHLGLSSAKLNLWIRDQPQRAQDTPGPAWTPPQVSFGTVEEISAALTYMAHPRGTMLAEPWRSPQSLCDLPEWRRHPAGDLMPLHDQMLFSAARVIGTGVGRRRVTIGTAFIVSVRSEAAKREYPYVLTAHHVLKGQQEIQVQFPNAFGNGDLYDPVDVSDWRQPLKGVDLALAPWTYDPARPILAYDLEYQVVPGGKVGNPRLGSRIFYVGILLPLERPMARSGTIGALHQTGVLPDRKKYDYPAHLVDCRSYDGFSGSPCFLELPFPNLTPRPLPMPVPVGTKVLTTGEMTYLMPLCGMFTDHLNDESSDGTVSRYGVGLMLRGNEIRSALMTDVMREERQKWDAELSEVEKNQPPFQEVSVQVNPWDVGDEYANFENLTRILVQAPSPKRHRATKSPPQSA